MTNQNQQVTSLPIDRKMLLSIREAAEPLLLSAMLAAGNREKGGYLGNTTQWELRASADLLPHYTVLPLYAGGKQPFLSIENREIL